MALFWRSLLFGIAIEFLLICICAIGFATSHGDVPNSILMAMMVLHYPFASLASYLVPDSIEIIVTGIFAVLAWTGLVYFVLFLSKRLFKKRDDHVA